MIVEITDFKLDAFVPNVDDAPNSAILGNDKELQAFIDEFEKEILIRTLGWQMYSELLPELDKLPFNPDSTETAEQKWIDLVNGIDNYRGMKQYIVSYVFWNFIKADDSHYTTSHVVKEKTESADIYDSREKAIAQWRKFYEYAIGTYYQAVIMHKPSGTGIIWGGNSGVNSNFKSTYSYINEVTADFPNWNPESFKNKNYFDA